MRRNYLLGNTESNFRVALSFTNLNNDYSLGGMIVIRGLYKMGAPWKSVWSLWLSHPFSPRIATLSWICLSQRTGWLSPWHRVKKPAPCRAKHSCSHSHHSLVRKKHVLPWTLILAQETYPLFFTTLLFPSRSPTFLSALNLVVGTSLEVPSKGVTRCLKEKTY